MGEGEGRSIPAELDLRHRAETSVSPGFSSAMFMQSAGVFINNEISARDLRGVSLGLSGGIDSITMLYVLHDLGYDVAPIIVRCNGIIRRNDILDAEYVCQALGLEPVSVDLTPIRPFLAYPGLDTGHLLMGVRNTYIKEIAENSRSLLIGTGHKTELLSGLFAANTYLGQIFPFGNLVKSDILMLAGYLGVPKRFIRKPSHSGIEGDNDDTIGDFPLTSLDSVINGGPDDELAMTMASRYDTYKRFFSFPALE